MTYVKLNNGVAVPYSLEQFCRANPRTVYGPSISDRHLNQQGVYRVSYLPKPEQIGMNAIETAGELQGSEWVVDWTLVSVSADEARAIRNNLLAECDWTQVADAPVDQAAWATYRQALRDITAQAGFPNDIVWPTKVE